MNNKLEFRNIVEEFLKKSTWDHRYRSFDYCYNYFKNTSDLNADMEKSCLTLGFYLASWGMYRGSSFMLQTNLNQYIETVKYLNKLKMNEPEVWNIDIDIYTDENIKKLIEIYKELSSKLIPSKGNNKKHRSITLITKLMLGVFGSVPAFDKNFATTFKYLTDGRFSFTAFNSKSLKHIKNFYTENATEINNLSCSIKTLAFETNNETSICYTRAKIIDMYGFGAQIYQNTGMPSLTVG